MTESQVVNEWINQGKVQAYQQNLLHVLARKFPGLVSGDLSRLIGQQDSLALLDDWLDAAVVATSIEEFVAVLRL